MTDPVPLIVGTAGLTGRQQIVRVPDLEEPDGFDEAGNPVFAEPRAPGKAIPAPCLHALHSLRGTGCTVGCPGVQKDGGCLCDVVRAAEEQGVDWKFRIEPDEHGNQDWIYDGPELAAG